MPAFVSGFEVFAKTWRTAYRSGASSIGIGAVLGPAQLKLQMSEAVCVFLQLGVHEGVLVVT
eukprot:13540007-Alexandrium_andersonii.AAC.1